MYFFVRQNCVGSSDDSCCTKRPTVPVHLKCERRLAMIMSQRPQSLPICVSEYRTSFSMSGSSEPQHPSQPREANVKRCVKRWKNAQAYPCCCGVDREVASFARCRVVCLRHAGGGLVGSSFVAQSCSCFKTPHHSAFKIAVETVTDSAVCPTATWYCS